jgi:sec-independent protein translocase protein TatA
MGDVAKGIKSFKKGLAEDDSADTAKSDAAMKSIDHPPASEAARRAEADSKVERSLS